MAAVEERIRLDDCYRNISQVFRIKEFNSHQKKAIDAIILEKKDVFVNLPTGSGKSLVFQAMPLMFDLVNVNNVNHSIIIVVSPLINLMLDQVNRLNALGITSVCLSEVENMESVEAGQFSVVYGTPKSWLKNERWRCMLSSQVYQERVCAVAVDEAHVIKQWGTSMNSKHTAFREVYSRLHEFRSLLPSVNILALTATAAPDTVECIMETLLLVNPYCGDGNPKQEEHHVFCHLHGSDF
ncbi:hypothetical protein QZH41_015613 [Actinostola sp. cb2023]|nr:hypothetical protein QZH41_015613 [Actinostola sp. cb2023]